MQQNLKPTKCSHISIDLYDLLNFKFKKSLFLEREREAMLLSKLIQKLKNT